MKSLILLISLLISGSLNTLALAGDEPKLKTYFMVMLKKGPNRDQDSVTVAEIQRGHMQHLESMAAAKKMCIAGPVAISHEIRGFCVYATATLEETKELVNRDPAIKSGRLIAEVIPWYSESGNCLP